MSDERKDGGPAYPTESEHQSGCTQWHYEGMSVLDVFAKGVMEATIEKMLLDATTKSPEVQDKIPELLAVFSYRMAEAMIVEREKRAKGDEA